MERWKKFEESERREYYASTKGKIVSLTKKTYKEKRLHPYVKHGYACIKINGEEKRVKNIIARCFLPNYKGKYENCVIQLGDNPLNCDIDNLLVLTRKELATESGGMSKNKPIKVIYDDKVKHYNSIRKAAAGLNVSYQTLLDYLNGRYKNSILNGMRIEYDI